MDTDDLKARIRDAFESVAAPADDDITPHRCLECDELAEHFRGCRPEHISAEHLDWHRWDLPLLSAHAKRYFLPAWLFASIDRPTSEFTDALVFNFDSDHRHAGYTEAQRAVIREYLEFILALSDDIDREDVESALARWR